MNDLQAAGLSSNEAICYKTLLDKPSWTPPELARAIGETRSNCYKLLDKLVTYGLAERIDIQKKLHYSATNPGRLLELAREHRHKREQAEQRLESSTQGLTARYIELHERPGIRYFQGKDEISQLFTLMAASKTEIVFVNTPASIDFYGFETLRNFRMMTAWAGVQRRALTPDFLGAPHDYAAADALSNLTRTWLAHDDYTAPVEWGSFDDYVYIISYGQEAVGTLIENKQIAMAFRQLFDLLDRGQKLLPSYEELPTLANETNKSP